MRDITRLQNSLPNTKMSIFGSSQSGLGTKYSDIDVIIHLNNDEVSQKFSSIIGRVENTGSSGFGVTLPLRKARIPLIKLLHRETKIEVDITFDTPSFRRTEALQNTKLIRAYVSNNIIIRKLYLFIKLIFGYKELFDASKGGLSSYAHSLIIIYFLINKMKISLLDINTFEEKTQGEQNARPAEVVIKYLNFVVEELPYLKVDIRKIDKIKEKSYEYDLIGEEFYDYQCLEIRDPYENRNLAKNFKRKNLYIFKNLALEWLEYFQNNESFLLQHIKRDAPTIVQKAVDAYDPRREQ